MATKEKQIRNSFIYLLPIIVGNLIPIITLPIFTRILTKEDYGVWGLAQVYAIFMSGLANFGLIIGYERNFFQYKDSGKSAALLYSTLFFVLSVLIVFGLFTYFFKSSISRLVIGSSEYSEILFWSYCSTGILSLKNYYLAYFKNSENAKSFAHYTIDESILGFLFSFIMVVYLRIGVIGLIWGQLVASLIIFGILSVNFIKLYPLAFDREGLRASLKLSYPLTPRIFMGVIGSQFDKYMIGLMATIGGVGVYSIGQKVANAIFTFMTAIQNVYSPQVYKRMFDLGEEGGESVGRYLTPFAYISVAAALIVSLFSEEIIYVLTPESYHGAIDIVIVLSMYYASLFFGKQPQLLFMKKTFIISIFSLFSIALNVGLNIPFIMKWGAIGAAWATFISGLISGTIIFAISQRYYEIKWEYRKVTMIFAIFFISSLMVILLRNMHVDYYIRIIIKLISLSLYVYLGAKIHVVTIENFRLLKRSVIGKSF
ncbi:MAG: oligosaccharide flippase family protein [Thermodesulfovibrionia bacterium]|nr:oligosaccharide flippase family protein [Thermodesulfovibrionia bacterium]